MENTPESNGREYDSVLLAAYPNTVAREQKGQESFTESAPGRMTSGRPETARGPV